MKKGNKILLIVFSFIVSFLIGYALFSENITVTGTATAKGIFDYEISCYDGVPNEFASTDYKSFGYENATCNVSNNNSVSYSVDLKYPTSTSYFTQEITNTGTIPIEIYLDQVYEYEVCTYNKTDNSQVGCTDAAYTDYSYGMLYGFKTAEGTKYSDPELGSTEHYNSKIDAFILETGDTIYLGVKLMWPDNWTDKNKYFKVTGNEQFLLQQATN